MAEVNRSNWTSAETRCLIGLWNCDRIQSKMETFRKKEAFGDIAEAMKEEGYNRTPKQVQKKIRDLKYSYRRIRDSNNRSGRGRSNWEFYDLIDSFLVDRAATQPTYLVETTPEAEEDNDGEDEEAEDEEAGDEEARSEEAGDDEARDEEAGGDLDSESQASSSPRGPTPPPELEDANGNFSLGNSNEEADNQVENETDNQFYYMYFTGVKTTDKRKKTRLEAAMSELTKAMTTVQDTNKKEDMEMERKREERWEEQELKLLKMQQEHEMRMMSQFMSTMAQFFSQAQGYPAPRFPTHHPHSQGHLPTASTSRGPAPFHYPPLNFDQQQPSTSRSHSNMYEGPPVNSSQQWPTTHNQSDVYGGPRSSTPINHQPSSSQQWPTTHNQSDVYGGPRSSTPINHQPSSSQQWLMGQSNVEEEEEPTYFAL
ncbi:hypothetical protein Bbelb_240030 [Branchiostoma belcheri]|nr:hypothetical protein Bbelb_240030 [Branchiostoma belcheri]